MSGSILTPTTDFFTIRLPLKDNTYSSEYSPTISNLPFGLLAMSANLVAMVEIVGRWFMFKREKNAVAERL
jgi:hypothetical protein